MTLRLGLVMAALALIAAVAYFVVDRQTQCSGVIVGQHCIKKEVVIW